MAGSTDLCLSLRPEIGAVPELLDRLERYAGEHALPGAVATRLALVCEEWLANVAMHAVGASIATLRLHRASDGLHLRLCDDGPPFDPLSPETPDTARPLAGREIGGLGLHLVRRMTLRLEYRREEGCNRLLAVLGIAAGEEP